MLAAEYKALYRELTQNGGGPSPAGRMLHSFVKHLDKRSKVVPTMRDAQPQRDEGGVRSPSDAPINSIPDDVLHKIVNELPPREAWKVAMAAKAFHTTLKHDLQEVRGGHTCRFLHTLITTMKNKGSQLVRGTLMERLFTRKEREPWLQCVVFAANGVRLFTIDRSYGITDEFAIFDKDFNYYSQKDFDKFCQANAQLLSQHNLLLVHVKIFTRPYNAKQAAHERDLVTKIRESISNLALSQPILVVTDADAWAARIIRPQNA